MASILALVIALVAAVINSLGAVFYFFISATVNQLYTTTTIDSPNSLLQHGPALMFLLFAITSWWFWFFLRGKSKLGVNVSYGLIVSIALLVGPFLIFYLVGVYANTLMSKSIENTFK